MPKIYKLEKKGNNCELLIIMFQHCQIDMHWLGSVSLYKPYGKHSDAILWLYCTTILVLLVLQLLKIQQGMGASIHFTGNLNIFMHLLILM